MKKTATLLTFTMVSLALFGQEKPRWLNENQRAQQYPVQTFYTGFAYNDVPPGKSLQDVTQQVKTEAQADLSKKIRVQILSKSQNQISAASSNGQYDESESFTNQSTTESSTEVVGVKIESYYDRANGEVYAFAYANKYELIGYYKGSLAMNLTQAEGLLQTARNLEAGNEKAKARQQCEMAKPLLGKVRYAQDLLTAVDVNATAADLQQQKTEQLHNALAQMQARLAQGVYVYVECEETNFTKMTTLVESRLKAALARKGCSFVLSPSQADFQLYITATTRHHSDYESFATCYADVQVNLVDTRKKKSIFKDEISQKGTAATKENAGRMALEDVVPVIAGKLSSWIEN